MKGLDLQWQGMKLLSGPQKEPWTYFCLKHDMWTFKGSPLVTHPSADGRVTKKGLFHFASVMSLIHLKHCVSDQVLALTEKLL